MKTILCIYLDKLERSSLVSINIDKIPIFDRITLDQQFDSKHFQLGSQLDSQGLNGSFWSKFFCIYSDEIFH